MFAGPLSALTVLVDAVRTAVAGMKETPFRDFGRQCSRAYREERERIIETEVLAEYDIDSYDEYKQLKNADRDYFDALTDKIKHEEKDWNLLFFGFDDSSRPHIFVVTEYGKIEWCDKAAFGTIGSGGWLAHNALSQFGYNRFMSRGEAVYGLLAAKFTAESADGVGETTSLMRFTAKDRIGKTVPGLSGDNALEIKNEWRQMSRYPDQIPRKIERMLSESEREPRQSVDNPLRGYIRRSTSRSSTRDRSGKKKQKAP